MFVLRLLETLLAIAFFYHTFKWLWKQWVLAGIKNKGEELHTLDRATIAKETAIGVAEKMAQVQFPNLMIIGGGSNGGSQMNPFDAVGLESFMRLSDKLTNTYQETKSTTKGK